MSIVQSPGELLQRRLSPIAPRGRLVMAPALAYGRHRGPATPASRLAAVAVAVYQDRSGQWTVPLTLRPTSLKHHGGQVCLPGGRIEAGEQARDAAVREFEEELGVAVKISQHCGELSTQYVYASDNLVSPVVFIMEPPKGAWRPDPVEVAKVIPLPLSVLSDRSRRIAVTRSRSVRFSGTEVGQFQFRAKAIRHDGHEIWGATALILEELAQILQPIS